MARTWLHSLFARSSRVAPVRRRRPRPHEAVRGQKPRTKLWVEILEDRTLLSTSVGLTLVDSGVTLPELTVSSYSWGATNPSGAKPSVQDLSLTLKPNAVEPGLWGHMVAGNHLSSATLHVSKDVNGVATEYITYTLTNAFVSSFTTAENSGGTSPQDTIKLHFGQVQEKYYPTNADGSQGKPNIADYNVATNRSGGAGSLKEPTPLTTPQVGLSFVENGVTLPELEIGSYSWGASKPSGAKTSVQDMSLTLPSSFVEPGLWGALTAGIRLSSATLHVRQDVKGVETEYITYTLKNVFISSFTTTAEDGGDRPQDTIQLHFGEVQEKYYPINANGSLGTPNIADYNVATNKSGGAGSLGEPALSTTPKPQVGLSFVQNGVTLAELAISSYSWGATNTSGTKTSVQDLSLTLRPGSVEPGLWGHLAAGTRLSSVILHVRKDINEVETEYITYTLTNVLISSFTTSEDSGNAPKDTIQLHFGQVQEKYYPINVDGSLGKPNTADYNVATNKSGGAGSLKGPILSNTPQVGLSFVQNGVTLPELAISSYSWGATNPSGTKPSVQNLSLTLTPGSVEPGLWGALTASTRLPSAILHVRNKDAKGVETEYITYTLKNVLISSFTTSEDGGTAPQDTIQLHFVEVQEKYYPINADGSQGKPNIADYNVAKAKSGGAGSLKESDATGTPQVGLSFVQNGVTLPELEVSGYSWGATNAAGTRPSMQDLSLTLPSSFVEPGLWGALTAGIRLSSATLNVRQDVKGVETEYITYTLKNVVISSFTTSEDGGNRPQDTIQLHFGEVQEKYYPINADGNRGTPNTADYNVATARSGGAGSLKGPTLSGTPQVGLSFVEKGVTLPELAISSYSWGATNASGTKPSLQDLSLTLDPSAVEPGLWGHLAAGIHLQSATIHVRKDVDGVATEYITYVLKNVYISSFKTSEGGGTPPQDTIQLHFGEVQETYSPINANGKLGTSYTADYNRVTNKSVVPTVSGVSSTAANGTYATGSVIDVTIAFNEAVLVSGTPQLALNSGGTATYSGGSGTDTLTFVYTVAAGQNANPLDEASANALTLNGGTIIDISGNKARLPVPAPGTTGSLGVNKDIIIRTYVFQSLNAPNAGTAAGQGTQAETINNAGQIVGSYQDSGGAFHGFLLSNGQYTILDDTNAGTGANQGTQATGLNNNGQIVGDYIDASGVEHGFVLQGGTYKTLDGPTGAQKINLDSINDNGQIVGNYTDASGVEHGFLYSGGQYTVLDDPNAGTAAGQGTFAASINNNGQIVGGYFDASGEHGFLYSNGAFSTIDVPGASSTECDGINNLGQIVGNYTDANGVLHGFLYSDGAYTILDDSSAGNAAGQGTLAFDINDSGQIVGLYVDGNGVYHGFLATP
jgi:probable HAF family extracellular repeat protein